MQINAAQIPYSATGFFSKIVIDYLNKNEELQQFYKHPFDIDGIVAAMAERKLFPQKREILVTEICNQYHKIPLSKKLDDNIQSLLQPNTFTVTTAHQPNIFTGPLFFIYKILHTIKLAETLNNQFAQNHFVPVYYMGSEDADIEEVGNINIDGISYYWQTKQTGAVGRMKVDKAFIDLLQLIEGQISVLEYGETLVNVFKKVYTEGKIIQQATLELINILFGEYGLVVLIPDNANLKKLFIPVVEKELKEQFSHKAVEQTVAALEKQYKVQAAGRELNLFYLFNDKRERIERQGDNYIVLNQDLSFSPEEIMKEVNEHPERFSPNVILRGVFQEMVLPNIAFIGGGGELGYWLELKKVFELSGVPYPMLILRNSFLLINSKWKNKILELGITSENVFLSEHELMNQIVAMKNEKKNGFDGVYKKMDELYHEIMQMGTAADITLKGNAEAIKTRAVKDLRELEKKMMRAEKRKYETEQIQLQKLKEALFPSGKLQERTENIASFYGIYGVGIFNKLLENSLALQQRFSLLNME